MKQASQLLMRTLQSTVAKQNDVRVLAARPEGIPLAISQVNHAEALCHCKARFAQHLLEGVMVWFNLCQIDASVARYSDAKDGLNGLMALSWRSSS